MKIALVLVKLIVVNFSVGVALAVPVVDWNTVGVSYSINNENDVTFNLWTTGAAVMGGGQRENDGLWTTLDANSSTVGIALRFFVVNYGDLIDWNLAETSVPFADNISVEYGSVHIDFDLPVYMGFRLGGADYCPEAEYGWAQLNFDGDTVSILSSATERTGLGIYAGTGTAIAEPATAGLLLLGTAVLARRRRRP